MKQAVRELLATINTNFKGPVLTQAEISPSKSKLSTEVEPPAVESPPAAPASKTRKKWGPAVIPTPRAGQNDTDADTSDEGDLSETSRRYSEADDPVGSEDDGAGNQLDFGQVLVLVGKIGSP